MLHSHEVCLWLIHDGRRMHAAPKGCMRAADGCMLVQEASTNLEQGM